MGHERLAHDGGGSSSGARRRSSTGNARASRVERVSPKPHNGTGKGDAMETRNRSTIFTGLVVDIEQFQVKIGEKGWHTYQVVRHPGGVAVLPLHDDGTVTLIRQLRPAVDAVMLELPAGRLSPGEEPVACGLRELAEETGLVAARLAPLGFIHSSPGVFDEVIHLYLATGLTQAEANP